MTQFSLDMFADPQKPVSADGPRPTVASFRGRLVMITPQRIEKVPHKESPGVMIDRITADVVVVDGRGDIPQMSYGQPTGVMIPGDEFRSLWIENTYLIDQMRTLVGAGRPMIGTVDTKVPGTHPTKGNPWGLIPATMEQKQQAVNYLNSRSVNGAAAPPAILRPPAPAPAAATTTPAGSGNPFA
jgi:hypothetical protein